MNILSVTTQKPHSTGSGTYLSEVVRALDRQGHRQAVVAGIYHSDIVSFPDGVTFHPVYYTAPGESPLPGDLDFPVLGMSDRILIYHEGRIINSVMREQVLSGEADQMSVLNNMFGNV